MPRFWSLFLLFFIFLTSGTCHALMSIDQEAQLGQQVLEMLRKKDVFITDPEITNYINRVGQRIVAHVGPHYFPFRFFVVQDTSINAFAVPGGLVFINSGLIEIVDREDELAGVIAHELAHVQCRHLAKRIEKLFHLNLATAAVTIAALLLSRGQGANIIATTTNALAITQALAYSRADEEEADRQAFEYLVKAGYDPRGMIEIFNKIVRHSWLLADNAPSYLLTHPTTPERISYLESLIKNYRPKESYQSHNLLLRRVQIRLRVITHDPGSLILRYRQCIRENPKDPLLHYGLALALARMHRYPEALKEMHYVLKALPKEDMFQVDLGRLYFEATEYKKALEVFKAYVIQHPQDPTARYFLARTYLALKQYPRALEIFKGLGPSLKYNPDYHYFLGQLYAQLGQKGQAHYQWAQYFLLTGDRQVALYHLRKAYQMLSPKDPLRARIALQLKSVQLDKNSRKGAPGKDE